jgi:hypothetical protein
MWQEGREELTPGYTPDEVTSLERALAGSARFFYRRQFEELLANAAVHDSILRALLERHGPDLILQDLFRLGMIGNNWVVGDANHSEIRSRWTFRGDTTLALDRRMAFHRSLWQHLTLVDSAMYAAAGGKAEGLQKRRPSRPRGRAGKRK